MSHFSNLIDQLDDLNQQDIQNTSRLLGVAATLYERLQGIVNAQTMPNPELPIGQGITETFLKKQFGSFAAAKNAYGVKARGWKDLVEKVQDKPLPPLPIPLEKRVEQLEKSVESLSLILLQLLDQGSLS
jgi:hypothetical protein